VAILVDTNILVYCFDATVPSKQERARDLLRRGVANESLRLPHQSLVEFVRAVTRSRPTKDALLSREEATLHVEGFMSQFPVLYPNEQIFRTALLGMGAYRLPWFDAHLWAYAEHYGLRVILSEDFQDGRLYGTVRVRNPFVDL
jgi:predicted nucleic acid-binding protein